MLPLQFQQYKWLVLAACLVSSNTYATATSTQVNLFGHTCSLRNLHSVFSLVGGYAALKPTSGSQTFAGTDDDQFIYHNNGASKSTGLVGVFAGIEWQPSTISLINRLGIEYDYVNSIQINGASSVGVQGDTLTPYTYHYHDQNQQVLLVAKVLWMPEKCYHPYAMIGLGAAFNRLYGFTTSTTQQGSINLTPTFSSNTNTAFAYSLGLGMEVNVNSNMHIGIGYRFSDFGKSTFNDGVVSFNDYQAAVPFSLKNNHTYANQLIIDLNFLA